MRKLFILFTIVYFVSILHQLAADDWDKWGGPDGNFHVTSEEWNPKRLAGKVKILWEFQSGRGFSSVTIKDGKVYTAGFNLKDKKDYVYCLDVTNGDIIWEFSYSSICGTFPGPGSTPVPDDNGRLFMLSKNGLIHCLDAITGKKIWQVDLLKKYEIKMPKYGLTGSVVIDGSMVILAIFEYGIALDCKTGDILWMSPNKSCGYSSAHLFEYHGRSATAVTGAQALFIVDTQTGEKLIEYPWFTLYNANATDPVIFDQKIFISSSYYKGCVLLDISEDKPVVLWNNSNMMNHFNVSVYQNGYLYGVSDFADEYWGELVCLNAKTGRKVWSEDCGVASVTLADDIIILLSSDGVIKVVEADPYRYRLIAESEKIGHGLYYTAPVLSNERVFIRNDRGMLYCIDVK